MHNRFKHLTKKMASSPAPSPNTTTEDTNNNERYSSTSPPLPVDSGGPGSRSYTPALLDMFNKSSSSSSSKNNKNTTTTTNSNDDDGTHHHAMMNNNPNNGGVVSRGGAPNSDSKPPRHASFNFQIQSKQNNNNQIGNSSESSPLQPLPLIKDQLQVVEVTRNGRTRKVCFLFAFSSFFLSSTLKISLLKTILISTTSLCLYLNRKSNDLKRKSRSIKAFI